MMYLHAPTISTFTSMLRRAQETQDQECGGVSVEDYWLDYATFVKDMGERPEGLVLGRIDKSKGHSRENTRWMTIAQSTGKAQWAEAA